MGNVVRLHDGLRALYPDAVVFGGIGTREVVGALDRVRAILGLSHDTGDRSALTVAVGRDGLAIWAEAPVLTLRRAQLAAIGVDESTLELTALVSGRAVDLAIPLAVPAESAHIADRVLVALAPG